MPRRLGWPFNRAAPLVRALPLRAQWPQAWLFEIASGDHSIEWPTKNYRAEPEPGAKPKRFLQLSGEAQPRLTSGGAAVVLDALD